MIALLLCEGCHSILREYLVSESNNNNKQADKDAKKKKKIKEEDRSFEKTLLYSPEIRKKNTNLTANCC